MKKRVTKKVAALMALVILMCFAATGCTEALCLLDLSCMQQMELQISWICNLFL